MLSGSYSGPVKDGWFEGFGTYTYPTGVRYEGEFSRGEFHGKGTLVYPNGGKYIATWERGKMLAGEYEYYDGLKYDFDNWNYCTPNDRRFYTEIIEGLRPAGDTLIVNQAEGPKKIPGGTYDVGDGYYDPIEKKVYDYEHLEMFAPDEAEISWIVSRCRYNPGEVNELSDDEAVLPSPPSEQV